VEVYDPEGGLLKFYFVKGRVFAVRSIGLLLASIITLMSLLSQTPVDIKLA
jgi:hypothetical protein